MIIRYRIPFASGYVERFDVARPPGPAPNGRVTTVRLAAEASYRLALACLATALAAPYVLTAVEFAHPDERLAFLRYLTAEDVRIRVAVMDALRRVTP